MIYTLPFNKRLPTKKILQLFLEDNKIPDTDDWLQVVNNGDTVAEFFSKLLDIPKRKIINCVLHVILENTPML